MTFRAVTANLTLRTALHVGSGKSNDLTDDLVRRDTRGRLLIPGTAIAGALRSIATRLAPRLCDKLCQALEGKQSNDACQCPVCKLFGDVNPREENDQATAARLIVYDAVLDTSLSLPIRDGVGIDRVTGAAARREQIKFDYEVVPAGTVFKLRLEIDPKLPDDAALLPLLAATLAEWEQGRGGIGGRVNRGLGALQLSDVQFIARDLNKADALIDFLRDGPPWEATKGDRDWLHSQVQVARELITKPYSGNLPVARSWVVAEFILAATGPFLINDPTQSGRGGFDHAPLRESYHKDAKPVLPGSSLRGALRSQAERIARTLATLRAWDNGSDKASRKQAFLAICPACNPLTARTTDPVASCNSFIKTLSKDERSELDRLGAEQKLCLACYLFGSPWNGSRLRVEDAPFVGTQVTTKVLDFLAIDRFTGGGRDTAKFDAVVLWRPKFRARLLLENPEPWELGWLALVLRDLHQHLITVGFGAAKGFGECKIEDGSLTFGILHEDDFPLPADSSAKAAGQRLLQAQRGASGVYQTITYDPVAKEDWLTLAEGWVKAFNQRVQDFSRSFVLKEDSYFDLSDLYAARVL